MGSAVLQCRAPGGGVGRGVGSVLWVVGRERRILIHRVQRGRYGQGHWALRPGGWSVGRAGWILRSAQNDSGQWMKLLTA
jgi:hypothetical protein